MANILIEIGHPSDVHIFRKTTERLTEDGHRVHMAAVDRDMIIELLDKHQFPYTIIASRKNGFNLAKEIPLRTWNVWKIIRQQSIDVGIGVTNITVGVPMWLSRKPYISISDTEEAYNQIRTAIPFSRRFLTPESFYDDYGPKHIRYAGLKELAYLHPDVYTPNPSILAELGLSQDEPYFMIRFVAWNATHDFGKSGLTIEDKHAIVNELSKYGKIILSSEEDDIPSEFQHLITDFPRESILDLQAHAAMYIGEGNTMAAESATLGIPSIRSNPMDLGYSRDLQDRGLMFQLLDGKQIIEKIQEIMSLPNRRQQFKERGEKLISDYESITDVLVKHILDVLPKTN